MYIDIATLPYHTIKYNTLIKFHDVLGSLVESATKRIFKWDNKPPDKSYLLALQHELIMT